MAENRISSDVAVIVVTKTPGDTVKTRIAKSVGRERAGSIYVELLKETAKSLHNIPYHVAYTGSVSPDKLEVYFKNAKTFFKQTGENLGCRMRNACSVCRNMGYTHFIVIGCDCPQRDEQDIITAATMLVDGMDVVLGPVEDGGYHLAGVNVKGWAIFNAARWGEADLLAETDTIISLAGLKSMVLPMRSDVDTIEDYLKWQKKVTHQHTIL